MPGADAYELLVVIHQVSGPPRAALHYEFIVTDQGPCGGFMVLCRQPQAFVDRLFEDFLSSVEGWYSVEDP